MGTMEFVDTKSFASEQVWAKSVAGRDSLLQWVYSINQLARLPETLPNFGRASWLRINLA